MNLYYVQHISRWGDDSAFVSARDELEAIDLWREQSMDYAPTNVWCLPDPAKDAGVHEWGNSIEHVWEAKK